MKLEDAPSAGWYPDPERTNTLRWWDGTDWADERRTPPSTTEIRYELRDAVVPKGRVVEDYVPRSFVPRSDGDVKRRDTDEIVAQVRVAAREEVQRAADLFTTRSTAAVRSLQRVLATYFGTVLRWIRIALFVAAVLVIAWFVLQLFVQASLLNWFGDRIDSITDG